MTHPIEAAEAALPERDTAKPAEQQGLFRKFTVTRTDGSSEPGGKHHGCEYFVLDVDHDPHAAAALAAYADAVEPTHPLLAADMRRRYGLAALRAALPALREVPAPTIPHGWYIAETGAGEIVVRGPVSLAHSGSMTLPNTEDGSLPVRLLRSLCRAMLAAAPTAPSVREVEPVADEREEFSFWCQRYNAGHKHWQFAETSDTGRHCFAAWQARASALYAAPPAPAQPAQGGGVVPQWLRDVCRYISETLADGALSTGERKVARTIMHMLPLDQVTASAPPAEPAAAPGVVDGDAEFWLGVNESLDKARELASAKKDRWLVRYNDDGEFGQVTGWLYRDGGHPCEVTGRPVYVWSKLSDLLATTGHALVRQNGSAPDPIRDQLAKALGAMLTHMGMDEDEWNRPTFEQARAALAAASAPPAESEATPAPAAPDEPGAGVVAHISADQNGCATLEWWSGDKKLTLYTVSSPYEALLKSWGGGAEFVSVLDAHAVRQAFQWLGGAAQTDGQGARPAFWTTMAHIDAAKAGRPMYVSDRQGVEFCVPVHFGKPQPADDFRD